MADKTTDNSVELDRRYNLAEFCRFVGISKSSYYRYEEKGILRKAKRDDRNWRYFKGRDIVWARDTLKKKNFI